MTVDKKVFIEGPVEVEVEILSDDVNQYLKTCEDPLAKLSALHALLCNVTNKELEILSQFAMDKICTDPSMFGKVQHLREFRDHWSVFKKLQEALDERRTTPEEVRKIFAVDPKNS